jgi:5-aminolevulinate synthase
MGPALTARSNQLVATYASIASSGDVKKIHQENGIFPSADATVEMCPHASAARKAARTARELAAAAAAKKKPAQPATGCPFHHQSADAAMSAKPAKAEGTFSYENFYSAELDKKHKDQSYRYFNNINRLAAKFPNAHTSVVTDEVEVWCANDYLGMGNNPVVLETMQYVQPYLYHFSILLTLQQSCP